MAAGIVSWGAYLPYWRLERGSIGSAFGTRGGKGTRAVASYDEDTTTLGVEAARRALEPEGVPDPEDLFFSTPAYEWAPLVMVRLGQVDVARLSELVTDAWRMRTED